MKQAAPDSPVMADAEGSKLMLAIPSKDTPWSRRLDYQVVCLNPRIETHVAELELAMKSGSAAYRDAHRNDFYNIESTGRRFYVHVHDISRTVYLVAFSADHRAA